MGANSWFKAARRNGWQTSPGPQADVLLKCSKHGCPGVISRPLIALGEVPAPCELEHVGQYSITAFDPYRAIVEKLISRRHALGLSQEEVNDAAGFTDGHLNKLEVFLRIAQIPTLQLWAETVGLRIMLEPSPLPKATQRAIDRRTAPLRNRRKALPNG